MVEVDARRPNKTKTHRQEPITTPNPTTVTAATSEPVHRRIIEMVDHQNPTLGKLLGVIAIFRTLLELGRARQDFWRTCVKAFFTTRDSEGGPFPIPSKGGFNKGSCRNPGPEGEQNSSNSRGRKRGGTRARRILIGGHYLMWRLLFFFYRSARSDRLLLEMLRQIEKAEERIIVDDIQPAEWVTYELRKTHAANVGEWAIERNNNIKPPNLRAGGWHRKATRQRDAALEKHDTNPTAL